jgi:hypothetical protein
VLVAWLYNSTSGNLLVALLWHTMNNLALALFPTIDLVPGADPRGFVVQAVLYVLTAAVVLIWGLRTLRHQGISSADRPLVPVQVHATGTAVCAARNAPGWSVD